MQDKWQRKFTGPWLVTKVTGPVNVVIQRAKRTREIVCHIDKLKPYVADEMPTSWIQKAGDAQPNRAGSESDWHSRLASDRSGQHNFTLGDSGCER